MPLIGFITTVNPPTGYMLALLENLGIKALSYCVGYITAIALSIPRPLTHMHQGFPS